MVPVSDSITSARIAISRRSSIGSLFSAQFDKEMAERKKKEMPAAEHMKRAQYMMKIGNLDWAERDFSAAASLAAQGFSGVQRGSSWIAKIEKMKIEFARSKHRSRS